MLYILQRYALTQLFHKLYKWCVAEVVGYRKRVHHDIMVPKETYMATYAKLKDKYVEKWVRYAQRICFVWISDRMEVFGLWNERAAFQGECKFSAVAFVSLAIYSHVLNIFIFKNQRLAREN